MSKLEGPLLRRALQLCFNATTLAQGRVYQEQQRVEEVGDAARQSMSTAAA